MKHPKFKNESKTLKVLITCGGGIFGAITAYLLDSLNQTVYPDTGFDTSRFIDAYLGRKDPVQHRVDPKYEKLVRAYKCNRNFKNIDKSLLDNLYTLHAITVSCNHEKTMNDDLVRANYQKVVDEFLAKPSTKYYEIISSYFILLSLFINEEDIMFFVR